MVKLIFSSFFNKKVQLEESYKRLCKFISVNPNAIRYLAMYSSNELPFANAVNIMHLILKMMAHHIGKKMQVLGDIDQNQELEETNNSSKSKARKKIMPDIGNESEEGGTSWSTKIN